MPMPPPVAGLQQAAPQAPEPAPPEAGGGGDSPLAAALMAVQKAATNPELVTPEFLTQLADVLQQALEAQGGGQLS